VRLPIVFKHNKSTNFYYIHTPIYTNPYGIILLVENQKRIRNALAPQRRRQKLIIFSRAFINIFFASFWSTCLINFNCVALKETCMVRAALFSTCYYYYYYVCVCFCVGVLLECVISQCHTVLLLWELMRWRGQ
jgi:hypothetical protein